MLWVQVLQFLLVISNPISNLYNTNIEVGSDQHHEEDTFKNNTSDEKIISVRITSSVVVGRQKDKQPKILHVPRNKTNNYLNINLQETRKFSTETYMTTSTSKDNQFESHTDLASTNLMDTETEIPPDLVGANIEFIKQLYAKRGSKDQHVENIHPFQALYQNHNRHEDIFLQDMTTINPYDEKVATEDMVVTNIWKDTSNISFNLANSENSKLNKSDEILIQSSSKLVLDFSNDSAEHDENSKDSIFIFEDNKMSNSSKLQSYQHSNDSYDSVAESSIKSFTLNNNKNIEQDEDIENVPLARSVSFPRGAQNYISNIRRTSNIEREPKSQLTTINFSIIHDAPKNIEQMDNKYVPPSQPFAELEKKLQLPIVYSEPAKVYSEPAKFYSEPAKIYSEPAKIYSEPSKVYSEPAKVYSEPAKFYSEPASLHLPQERHQAPVDKTATSINTTPVADISSLITHPTQVTRFESDKNYGIDGKVGMQSNVRSPAIQDTTTEKCQQDNCKVGYVVEGRQFKKYRVEERTPDGFIVGEYGVVRNEDGALRGVRYTADSDASPRLIYDALMKFLQLR